MLTKKEIIAAIINSKQPRVRGVLWNQNMIIDIFEVVVKDVLITKGTNVNADVRNYIDEMIARVPLADFDNWKIAIEEVEQD